MGNHQFITNRSTVAIMVNPSRAIFAVLAATLIVIGIVSITSDSNSQNSSASDGIETQLSEDIATKLACGDPCNTPDSKGNPVACRSQWGSCGNSPAHCNVKSLWTRSACTQRSPTKTTTTKPAADTTTTSFDPVYDLKETSLNKVACSDGSHGLAAKYPTFGSLPGFPFIGGASQIEGWNSAACGTCWTLSFNGTSIHVLAIDHADDGHKGEAINLSEEAMDKLTNGQAKKLGKVQSIAVQVDKSVCGL